MIKGLFVDYTGTLMQEESPYAIQMARMVVEHSDLSSVREVLSLWWKMIKELEDRSYLDSYMTEDEILLAGFAALERDHGLSADRDAFVSLAHQFWSKSPAFEDVKPFFHGCSLPIYIITNNGAEYVEVFLRDNGLRCDGIICGDMVRAYKPHREIFERALQISGLHPGEVMHIGDSVVSDVNGALSAGITPCLLDRKRQRTSDRYPVCASLLDVLDLLQTAV